MADDPILASQLAPALTEDQAERPPRKQPRTVPWLQVVPGRRARDRTASPAGRCRGGSPPGGRRKAAGLAGAAAAATLAAATVARPAAVKACLWRGAAASSGSDGLRVAGCSLRDEGATASSDGPELPVAGLSVWTDAASAALCAAPPAASPDRWPELAAPSGRASETPIAGLPGRTDAASSATAAAAAPSSTEVPATLLAAMPPPEEEAPRLGGATGSSRRGSRTGATACLGTEGMVRCRGTKRGRGERLSPPAKRSLPELWGLLTAPKKSPALSQGTPPAPSQGTPPASQVSCSPLPWQPDPIAGSSEQDSVQSAFVAPCAVPLLLPVTSVDMELPPPGASAASAPCGTPSSPRKCARAFASAASRANRTGPSMPRVGCSTEEPSPAAPPAKELHGGGIVADELMDTSGCRSWHSQATSQDTAVAGSTALFGGRSSGRTSGRSGGSTAIASASVASVKVTSCLTSARADSFSAKMLSRTAPLPLRGLRLTVRATRSANTASTQLGEVALRCGFDGSPLDLSALVVSSPGGQSPAGEGPEKAVACRGKWLDLNFRSRGASMLVLEVPGSAVLEATEFRLRTASDSPGRDPSDVLVEGLVAGRGDGWLPLFGGAVGSGAGGIVGEGGACQLPVERRSWSAWLPLCLPATQAPEAGWSPPLPTPLRAAMSRRGGHSPAAVIRVVQAVPLDDLDSCSGGAQVDVEAWVSAVGELERKELPLQPGEFTRTRSLALRQGSASCLWTLWSEHAARFGDDLMHRRVRVRGARVLKFGGESRLSGCTEVEILSS